jgi:hypothetical protein
MHAAAVVSSENDPSRPTAARLYDYFVGGTQWFESDRQLAEQILTVIPQCRESARANRAFLHRAVCAMSDQGIDQFLDIGSGFPTTDNLHEIVQARRPGSRMVCVDIDPSVVAYGHTLLAGNPGTAMVEGDVRDPRAIFEHPDTRRLLDLARPVGVVLGALLHFLPDDREVAALLETLRAPMAPGSWLALTHMTNEGAEAHGEQLERIYKGSPTRAYFRSRGAVRELFEGFDLVDPGIVHTPLWRPDGSDDPMLDRATLAMQFAGVGRRRR